jgi:hypothetical protein
MPNHKRLEQREREPKEREADRSPHLENSAATDIARLEELEALYRPLREAVEAELGKTKSGRAALDDTHALGEELTEVARRVKSSEVSKDAQLALLSPLMTFRARHEERLVAAQAGYAHLRPSVEAVAGLVRPELPADTLWVSETNPFRGMLLEPKQTPTLEEVGTVGQGLGDPGSSMAMCAMPPWGRREEYPLAPPLGTVACGAELDGRIYTYGVVVSLFYVPEAGFSTAWLGNDFPVPAGFTQYEVTVDYEYVHFGAAFAMFGVSVVNQDVAILVDNLDGTFMKSAQSVSTMIVPVAAYDQFFRQGKTKVTLPFTRANTDAGTVRVMVGSDSHGFTMGLSGVASFGIDYPAVQLNEICVRPIG